MVTETDIVTDAEIVAKLKWFVERMDAATLEVLKKGEVPIVLFESESTLSALRGILSGATQGGFVGVEGERRKAAAFAMCKKGTYMCMYPSFSRPVDAKDPSNALP